jgi:hypothetical protein
MSRIRLLTRFFGPLQYLIQQQTITSLGTFGDLTAHRAANTVAHVDLVQLTFGRIFDL